MYKYIFSFLLYLLLVTSYLLSQYNSKILVQHNNLKDSFEKSFKGAVNSFELLNDSYHNRYEGVMAYIIKNASNASTKERDKIRYKLREKFTTLYNDRKLAELKTFHVFDKNGKSILRFHKLDKYDDLIINNRDSLKKILMTYKAQQGFEVGKYASSYRFQYPLFYDGTFVGSYEFGIEFDAIDKEMQKLFGVKNIMFINKKDIYDISTNKTTKSAYIKMKFKNDYFYELKSRKSKIYDAFKKSVDIKKISLINEKTTYIKFVYNDKNYLAMFSPLKDITGKDIGFILTFVEDKMSKTILRTFIEELFIAIFSGLLILFLIYKEVEYRKYIRNIIDTQTDILIVTDGVKLKDVNQAFFDFFDVDSINAFIKQGSECICDYFLKEDGYIQQMMEDKTWIEWINEFPEKEHIAILKDKNGIKRYMKIEINGFSKSKDFIVIFYDVTDDLHLKQELENKAYYDKLTNIYSRERFDHFLNEMLMKKQIFSLIMFDIDHFKRINDDYGHDIGDSVLRELTDLVSEHIREDDIFARWGGEEFMIIVNIDIVKAERFANKLRKIIEEHRFKHVKDITCSFGVASYRGLDKFETIIKRVDNMLYSAKNSGRNCVVVIN